MLACVLFFMGRNYKDTLNLPRTDFPMKAGLTEREPQMLAKWEAEGLYRKIQDSRRDAELFVLHDGPPFANGDVHMGTALNKILKDIIVKSRTMLGYRAPFVPGWDCHGLPIEFKVVKESRGLSPVEVRKKSEAYARKYIDLQREQFKRLGVFGDWERPYLTMDSGYEAEVIRAFAVFVEKGFVYQSKKPVYWSTGAQTALAEAEVEYAEREDPAIFVKFPIVGGDFAGRANMVIWTTTPWTLPANVAIALHPSHEYIVGEFVAQASSLPSEEGNQDGCTTFVISKALLEVFAQSTGFVLQRTIAVRHGSELAGGEAQHPFLDRKSRIIAANFVTTESGTGAVHIAPGHGADDYVAGVENGLPILSPVDEHGRFTEEVGVPVWAGKYVFDANADVIALLREKGALLGEEIYRHSYPHCWRSKTPVVFRAVEQFFIRIDHLRAAVLEAIDTVNWVPSWGRNRIFSTVESRPDWCISRQRSWGVPLPVFYSTDGRPILDPGAIRRFADLVEKHGTNIWFELDDAAVAGKLGLPAGATHRNDTLDVWIDSGISHQAVLRKNPALRAPADVYIEATDQHRGWFNSSITTSVALRNEAPYKTCITHGFVVDVDGKKISKSSSYQKPMDSGHFVGKHGADIVRLWVSSVNFTDEVPFSEEIFTRLSDTYRRIRNTLRILLGNLFDFEAGGQVTPKEELTLIDRWILDRLAYVIQDCRRAYETYEFHKVYHAINDFCAVDLSALYIDITKDRLYCEAADSALRRGTQSVMHEIFDALSRLLAPILVFTADEAWGFFDRSQSIHLQKFPEPSFLDAESAGRMNEALKLREAVGREIEPLRQNKVVASSQEVAVTVAFSGENGSLSQWWLEHEELMAEILIVSKVNFTRGEDFGVSVERTADPKCPRCWRHRPATTLDGELCDRCATVLHVDSHA
jgi:isoleucyl-tRNA synthetase